MVLATCCESPDLVCEAFEISSIIVSNTSCVFSVCKLQKHADIPEIP